MTTQEAILESVEYSVALIEPESRKVLAFSDSNGYRLPSVQIPLWSRPAEELQKAIRRAWGIHAIILEFLPSVADSKVCVAAQILFVETDYGLLPTEARGLHPLAMDEAQRKALGSLLVDEGNQSGPFARVGWIDDAVIWLEATTGSCLASLDSVDQYNAGGPFSLVRFGMENKRTYWMKATGEPNAHEPRITTALSGLCGDYLPEIISVRPSWNAWLMSEDATSVSEWPNDFFEVRQLLENAVKSMAELQMRTLGHELMLLRAGAFDQRTEVLQKRSAELFDYLEEAMDLQTSIKVPRLQKRRLREIHASFEEICDRVGCLDIGETIVHGDLNQGNILVSAGSHCRFIDWAEAYLCNPLVSLQNLLLLNRVDSRAGGDSINAFLNGRYIDVWAAHRNPEALQESLVYMPMMALASTMYGRGDWLGSPLQNNPQRQSYSRSLARYMDRALRGMESAEALCL